jgi:hypothetical protein
MREKLQKLQAMRERLDDSAGNAGTSPVERRLSTTAAILRNLIDFVEEHVVPPAASRQIASEGLSNLRACDIEAPPESPATKAEVNSVRVRDLIEKLNELPHDAKVMVSIWDFQAEQFHREPLDIVSFDATKNHVVLNPE